jgi:hypothetical protein
MSPLMVSVIEHILSLIIGTKVEGYNERFVGFNSIWRCSKDSFHWFDSTYGVQKIGFLKIKLGITKEKYFIWLEW